MKLILRTKRVKANEVTEFPDNAFDFAFSGVGNEDISVSYWELVE